MFSLNLRDKPSILFALSTEMASLVGPVLILIKIPNEIIKGVSPESLLTRWVIGTDTEIDLGYRTGRKEEGDYTGPCPVGEETDGCLATTEKECPCFWP